MSELFYQMPTNCPICNSSLSTPQNAFFIKQYKCPNRCYEFHSDLNITVRIFDAVFHIMNVNFNFEKGEFDEIYNEQEIHRLRERIDYWKENDRFLMEILNK